MRNTHNAAESRLRCPEPRPRAIIVQMVYFRDGPKDAASFRSQNEPLSVKYSRYAIDCSALAIGMGVATDRATRSVLPRA